MFTGIVEELGRVVAAETRGDSAVLTIRCPLVAKGLCQGDSVAVCGVCLTVTSVEGDGFRADVVAETLDRSNLGALTPGSAVNLERPVAIDGRLGGHLVQGHVDGTGEIVSREPGENWDAVRISLPPQLTRYVVAKGSIAVDGVSLTVVEADDTAFAVSVIPTTRRLTTFGDKASGELVNLEVDIVAKYVESLLGRPT